MALLQLRRLASDLVSHLVLPAANNRETTPQDLLEDLLLDLKVVTHLVDLLPHCPVASPLYLLVVDRNQGTHLVDRPPDDPVDFPRDLLVEDLKQVIHPVDPLDLN